MDDHHRPPDVMWGTDATASTPSATAGAVLSGPSITISMKSSAGTPRSSAIAGPPSSHRQGVRHGLGRFGKDVARGLAIRCDWGPQYIADAWINE